MTEQIHILLADDHPLVRTGIRATLDSEEDMIVIGEATNSDEVQQLCVQLQPHILLLDLNMPGSSAIKTVTFLRENCLNLKIMILTAYDDEAYIRGMMMIGVEGYMLKDEATEAVARAIRAIMKGDTWFSWPIVGKLAKPPADDHLQIQNINLTKREQDILELIGQGLDNSGLVKELLLAEQTVRNYVSRLYSKLGLTTRGEAIIWARKHGFGEE